MLLCWELIRLFCTPVQLSGVGEQPCCKATAVTTDGDTVYTMEQHSFSESQSYTLSAGAHLVVSRCARICLISCMHSAEPL